MPEPFLVLMCLADGAAWGGHCRRYVRKCLVHGEGAPSSKGQYVNAWVAVVNKMGGRCAMCLSGDASMEWVEILLV